MAPSLKTDKAKATAVLTIVNPWFSFLWAVLPDHTIYTFIGILRVAFKTYLSSGYISSMWLLLRNYLECVCVTIPNKSAVP